MQGRVSERYVEEYVRLGRLNKGRVTLTFRTGVEIVQVEAAVAAAAADLVQRRP